MSFIRLFFYTFFLFYFEQVSSSSNEAQVIDVRICAAGFKRLHLCERLRRELNDDPTLINGRISFFIDLPNAPRSNFAANLKCVAANHSFECVDIVREGVADLTRLRAEELYGISKLSRYSDVAPIAAGETQPSCPPSSKCHQFAREYSVALVSKRTGIHQLSDLRDRKACFGEVGSTEGWIIPIFKIRSNWTKNPSGKYRRQQQVENQRRDIYTNVSYQNPNARCPLDFTVANDVFPSSCAPGLWATENSFASAYSERLCSSCKGRNLACKADKKENHALNCLRDNKGDVAFLSNLEVADHFNNWDGSEANDYSLLCRPGLRSVFEHNYCHWGVIPSDSYIVYKGKRKLGHPPQVYGEFIHQLYSKTSATDDYYPEEVRRFLSGSGEIVVNMQRLDKLYNPDSQNPVSPSPQTYLKREGGEVFFSAMEGSFPLCRNLDKMRICVLSGAEFDKCNQIKTAFGAAALPDTLECIMGYSEDECINMINSTRADVAMISAHRADEAVHHQKIRPLLAESYGDSRPVYAVAVSLATGRAQKLKDLDSGQLNVCSSGTDSFAGWEAPNKVFKDVNMIAKDNCELTEAWAKMFRGGCVPGAENTSVTLGRNSTNPVNKNLVTNLCSTCGSRFGGSCLTPAEAKGSEKIYDLYYGDIGALRCLARRRGDVAFLRSSALQTMLTLKEMGDNDFRTLYPYNFILLCPDGKSKMTFSSESVSSCNLGKMPDRWMVSRADVDSKQLLRWQDLWIIAYNRARTSYNWLQTYVMKTDHILDLIFTNTTTTFKRFPVTSVEESFYHKMAYNNWISPFQCSGARILTSLIAVVISVIAVLICS